jgi:hypothetical protein
MSTAAYQMEPIIGWREYRVVPLPSDAGATVAWVNRAPGSTA